MRTAGWIVVGSLCAVATSALALFHTDPGPSAERLRVAAPTDLADSPVLGWLPPVDELAATPCRPNATRSESGAAPNVVKVSAFGRGLTRFEPNRGQSAPWVRWLRRGPGHVTLVADDGFATVVESRDLREFPNAAAQTRTAVRFRWADADSDAPVFEGLRPLASRTNYFRGRDPRQWVRGVPQFARVRCSNVWNGIDVILHGRDGHLTYDFVVAPGADPGRVVFDVDGADQVGVDERGDLVVTAGGVEIRHERPVVYQDTARGRRRVPGSYRLEGSSRVRFTVAAYDRSLPLVIDPTERFGHRVGGTEQDLGISLAVSATGTVALGGRTFSADFSGTGGLATAVDDDFGDTFVQFFPPGAFESATSTVGHLAIVGSNGTDTLTDVRFGPDGTLFVTGFTDQSATFPVLGPGQSGGLGGQDGFLFRIRPSGESLAFSAPFGGTGDDFPTSLGLAVDTSTTTRAYVGLLTNSADIPDVGTAPGNGDVVVSIFDRDGNVLGGRHLGGTGVDTLHPVRVDVGPTDVAVVFTTDSTDLIGTPGAFQETAAGGASAFIQILNPDLDQVQAATFLNGSSAVGINTLARDDGGNLFLGGSISGGTIDTTPNAFQGSPDGFFYGVAFALDANLSAAPFRSYIASEAVLALTDVIAVPVSSTTTTVFFAGSTDTGLPPVGGGRSANGAPVDIFLLQLDAQDFSVPFVGHFGGTNGDLLGTNSPPPFFVSVGRGIDFDPVTGNILIAGSTDSDATSFPELIEAPLGAVDALIFTATTTVPIGVRVPSAEALLELDDFLRGSVKDSSKPGKDSVSVSFGFAPGLGEPPLNPQPGGPGVFSFDLVDPAGGTATSTIATLEIPFDAPGWKARKGGAKLLFKSGRGETPKVSVVLDIAKGSGKATVKKTELPAMPTEGPALANFTIGAHSGSTETRLDERGGGKFKLVDPLEGLGGDITVTPGTSRLGDSLMVLAVLDNHSPDAVTLTVDIQHKGVTIFLNDVTVPARNAATLAPGTQTVQTFASPPGKGRGQPFDLIVDGERFDRQRVTVK